MASIDLQNENYGKIKINRIRINYFLNFSEDIRKHEEILDTANIAMCIKNDIHMHFYCI